PSLRTIPKKKTSHSGRTPCAAPSASVEGADKNSVAPCGLTQHCVTGIYFTASGLSQLDHRGEMIRKSGSVVLYPRCSPNCHQYSISSLCFIIEIPDPMPSRITHCRL